VTLIARENNFWQLTQSGSYNCRKNNKSQLAYHLRNLFNINNFNKSLNKYNKWHNYNNQLKMKFLIKKLIRYLQKIRSRFI